MDNSWTEAYYELADGDIAREMKNPRFALLVHDVQEKLKDGGALLEVGCGVAGFVSALPERASYTGIDVSDTAIEKAEARHTGNERVTLVQGKAETLPFPDASFNYVLAKYTLEHLPYPKESLCEMIRVLKPGGSLCLIAPNLEFPFAYPSALRHKGIGYRLWYHATRVKDYIWRLFGSYAFRTIFDNFLTATGRYELADDDLVYLVSSFEVRRFLERHRIVTQYMATYKPPSNTPTTFLKKCITFFPGMRYYGIELFLIGKKRSDSSLTS